ncbi:protein TIFY 5A-like [Solanum dulcamara]|uniref:protein TIFY 5A-like n=1 Tax=Solanum dulcamara TaxID=45834 RepID=UPI002486AD00|nr:protein TIFY 5A-like [Solanum dulcamara]
MRRNCNLELSLMPPSPNNFSMEDQELKNKQSQQLTIFYNGKFVVSDITELQAKAIIYLASKEMKEKTNQTSSPISEPSSPLLQPETDLFMKKSLQRFLQKRKNRIQTASPYHQ